MRLVLGMVLAMAVATVFSRAPDVSWREFLSERGLGLPFFVAIVWMAVPDGAAVRRLLGAFAGIAILVLLLAAVETVTGRSVVAQLRLLPVEKLESLGYHAILERRVGLPRVQSVFQHPLQLGAYLVALIPLVAALRRHATEAWRRALWSCTLALALFSLIFTWSRGAWLALLFALLLDRLSLGRWLVAALGAATFGIVWGRLGFLRPGQFLYRWWLIQGAARAMVAHAGFGTGPGTFVQSVVVHIAGTSLTAGVDPLAYSLTMAIEVGPLFVVLLWWFVLGTLRDGKRARDRAAASGQFEAADLLSALRAGLVANLVLSVFSTSLFGMTVGLFISLMLIVAVARLAAEVGASAAVGA